MFSTRTIAVIGVLVMATGMAAHAQGRRHTRDTDTDTDSDSDSDSDSDTAKAKAKTKAKAKAKARTPDADPDADADADADADDAKARSRAKAKAKAKAKDPDPDSDADADREKARRRERDRQDADADADTEKAKAKARERASEAASDATSGGGGGGEAYQSGTLGFSIPVTVVGPTTGAGTGEPVPTVDIVYFLDDKAALDLIVGLNFHRKQTVAAMGGATSDTNLIGVAAGLGYRMYSVKNSLRSFFEPEAVISLPDTSATASLTVSLGASLGLERNLTPWFSISGALGANLNATNSFKDIQLATTATLAANLYWQ